MPYRTCPAVGRDTARLIRTFLLILWLPALCAVPATAGQDENVVTPDKAAEAVAKAKPGSVVLLADGVYRDLTLRLKAAGTTNQPVTLRAQTPGRVLMTGKSMLAISGEHLVVSGLVFDQVWNRDVVLFEKAQHCRLTDCAFIECGNPASTFAHIVRLWRASQRCRVDHCYMQGNLSMGMGVKLAADDCDSTHNTFDHNFFKDILRRNDNGQEGIQVGQGSFGVGLAMHALVEHCLFDNVSGDAEIISNKSSCNTYRFNTFTNCRAALVLRGGSSVLVQGNIFQRCQGVVRIHAAHSFIVGNYADGCVDGLLLNMGAGEALDAKGYTTPHHCVIANNVIQQCKRNAISIGRPLRSTTVAPLANAFYNNVLRGSSGDLLEIVEEKDSVWKDNSLSVEGTAKPGAAPAGVSEEKLDWAKIDGLHALPFDRASRIHAHEAALQSRLAAMICPRPFDEVFPPRMQLKPLSPHEVGPAWMHGEPQSIRRIATPQPIPELPAKAKKKVS